jgi:membrane-associated phospholipid phosphatase
MDIFGQFSLEVTRWLQTNLPQLEAFFRYVTTAGRLEFYLVIITLAYWCINKGLGRALGYVLAVSYTLNLMVKHLVRNQRPFWDDPGLALAEERSYGIPSGHAQGATVFFGLLAMFIRRAWAWVLAIVLIFLIAVSRIYLGVHDIEDVVAGIVLGILVLLGYAVWNRYFVAKFNNRILGQRLLIAFAVPVILMIVYGAGLLLLDPPQRPPQFEQFVGSAERQSWEDSATIFGLLMGLGIGFIMESSRIRFMVDGSIGRRALRYLVGIAGMLVLWRGLGVIVPDDPLALAVPLRFLHYLILSLWLSYYAPWVFVRLKLADARPDPEVSLTV